MDGSPTRPGDDGPPADTADAQGAGAAGAEAQNAGAAEAQAAGTATEAQDAAAVADEAPDAGAAAGEARAADAATEAQDAGAVADEAPDAGAAAGEAQGGAAEAQAQGADAAAGVTQGADDGAAAAAASGAFLVLAAGLRFGLATSTVASSLYLILDVGLDPFQLVLVGTVLEGTILAFEVPTGVVADAVSRRRSIVVGLAVMGAGFLLYAVPHLTAVLAAQVVWGLGWTFVSGADVAWVTDEVGEVAARPLYLRAAQAGYVATLAGLATGVAIALAVGRWAAVAAGGVALLALAAWAAARLTETRPPRRPPAGAASPGPLAHVRATARSAASTVRTRPALLAVLAVAAAAGVSTEGFDRLRDLHLLRGPGFPESADPVVWVALLGAASLAVAVAVASVVRRRVDLAAAAGPRRAVGAVNAALAAATVGFALAGAFPVAVAFLVAGSVARHLEGPLLAAWVNRDLDPATRATVNSLAGQADALGQVVGGPAVGALAAARSVAAALVLAGLLRAPAAAALLRRPSTEPARRPA
ncbi:MAG TPA: MFS transporter [Acidimicrobiales bacterium]